MARFATFTRKFDYQRQSGSQGYKSRRYPGMKIQQKGNFLQQKHSSAKKHNKVEIFIKKAVPLPLASGNLPEIVLIHQLRDTQSCQTLVPNVKVSNFFLAGRLQYFIKHWKKLTSNHETLEWVSGLKIDFILGPLQKKIHIIQKYHHRNPC